MKKLKRQLWAKIKQERYITKTSTKILENFQVRHIHPLIHLLPSVIHLLSSIHYEGHVANKSRQVQATDTIASLLHITNRSPWWFDQSWHYLEKRTLWAEYKLSIKFTWSNEVQHKQRNIQNLFNASDLCLCSFLSSDEVGGGVSTD